LASLGSHFSITKYIIVDASNNNPLASLSLILPKSSYLNNFEGIHC
jgi:hypothetical protein